MIHKMNYDEAELEIKYSDTLKRQEMKFSAASDYLSPVVSQFNMSSYPVCSTGQFTIPSSLSSNYAAVVSPDSAYMSSAQQNYLGFPHDNPKKRRRQATIAQRRAANIRERKRMLSLNDAFEELRHIVPTFSHEKKISRIDTLRLAIIYISFMADLLEGKDDKEIEIKSLKHGWTSVREKLQQQMAAQQHQQVAGMQAAAALSTLGGPEFPSLMLPSSQVMPNYQPPSAYMCPPAPQDYYSMDIAAQSIGLQQNF